MPGFAENTQAYAAVFSVLLSAVGLGYASRTFLAQKRATDVTNVLTIFERLDHHWRLYRENKEDQSFEFGQLISYYEVSCALFRYKAFHTELADVLLHHLSDVLKSMRNTDHFNEQFEALKSQPDNYENIEWLCNQPSRLSANQDGLAIGLQRIYADRGSNPFD